MHKDDPGRRLTIWLNITVALALTALGLAAAAACASHPNVVTPEGNRAIVADRLVHGTHDLMVTTIDLNAAGKVSDHDAVLIVSYVRAADLTLDAVPTGDPLSVGKAAFANTVKLLPPALVAKGNTLIAEAKSYAGLASALLTLIQSVLPPGTDSKLVNSLTALLLLLNGGTDHE